MRAGAFDPPPMTPLGRAALTLARRGLRVFPVVSRAKKPAIGNNLALATTDETVIRGWWRTLDFNVGVASGDRIRTSGFSTSTAVKAKEHCAGLRLSTAQCRRQSRRSPAMGVISTSGGPAGRSGTPSSAPTCLGSMCVAKAVSLWHLRLCTRRARSTRGASIPRARSPPLQIGS